MPPLDDSETNYEDDSREPDDLQFDPSADPSSNSGVGKDDEGSLQSAWNYLRAGVDSSAQLVEASHGEREHQQAELIAWAKRINRLIPADAIEGLVLVSDDTSEHKVRHRSSDDRALKVTWPGFYGQVPVVLEGKLTRANANPAQYLIRQILHNVVFDGQIFLEGVHVSDGPSLVIGEPPGQPSLVISQPWYQAADKKSPHPTPESVDVFMRAQSFLPVQGSYFGWARPHDGVIITDAKPDNFVLSAAGIVPIDLQIAQTDPVLVRQIVVD